MTDPTILNARAMREYAAADRELHHGEVRWSGWVRVLIWTVGLTGSWVAFGVAAHFLGKVF